MTASENNLESLQRINERGWRSGLAGLMRAEFGAWWRTSNWWTQSLLWTAVINGSLAAVIWGDLPDDVSVFMLYGVMTMFASIAVAILMQETIVGEKRSGTAAWIHSKPVSRPAFVLSKLIPNASGVLATMIVVPSLFLFVHMTLGGIDVAAGRFVLGAGVAALNLLFYLTLTLMLGTLSNSAGPVIAVPLAFAFGQQLIMSIPGLNRILPWALVVPTGESGHSVVSAVITGNPIPAPGAIVFALVACAMFTAVAFWKWSRTEL